MKSNDGMYDDKKNDTGGIDDEDTDDEKINHVICCMKAISTANMSIFGSSASDTIQRTGSCFPSRYDVKKENMASEPRCHD